MHRVIRSLLDFPQRHSGPHPPQAIFPSFLSPASLVLPFCIENLAKPCAVWGVILDIHNPHPPCEFKRGPRAHFVAMKERVLCLGGLLSGLEQMKACLAENLRRSSAIEGMLACEDENRCECIIASARE